MNKIHREKADIEVAFSSGLNNLRCMDTLANDLDVAQSNTPEEFKKLSPLKHHLNTLSSQAKKIIRRVARVSFRLAKPFIRPVVSKARFYLTREILEESRTATEALQLEIQKLSILAQQNQELLKSTARRVFVPCGQEEILVNTNVGYIVCSAKDPAVLASISESGELVPGTRRLIERFLIPGNVFIDVGAGLGLNSLAAARAMKGRGKIIAFESSKETKELFEKSVWINGFSKLIEIHQALPDGESIDGKQRVDLIKIDLNSALIESCKAIIKKNPELALIVEFNLANIKQSELTTAQWLKHFTDLGLSFKVIDKETSALENWSMKQLENSESVTLFFARQDSSAWEKAGK